MKPDGGTQHLQAEARYSEAILWSAALVLFFWALGERGLWGSEGRWAEVTREMLLTGDFFHPTINGVPYFDKPLLSYWLIALVSGVTGSLDEWTVRLPSALSGLLALWGTVSIGRRLWSRPVGVTAGWILMSTYGFLFWARTGSADMENLAAIVLAVAWYWRCGEKPGFLSYLVFYLILFLGAQTKGLTALIVPVLAVLPDLVRRGRWRLHLSPGHLAALLVGAGVYLVPFLLSELSRGGYRESGLFLVFRENILRYVHPFDHKEPFYVYLYQLPQLFLPWSPLLLAGLFSAGARFRTLDGKTRWLAESFVIIFLFFTFSGSRRIYYILPALPFCALLTSIFMNEEGKTWWRRLFSGLQTGILALVSLMEIASPALWPVIRKSYGIEPPEALILAGPLIGLPALLALIPGLTKSGRFAGLMGVHRKSVPLIAATVILMGGSFCWQQGILESYRPKKRFALELKSLAADIRPERIAFYPGADTDVLFYLAPQGRVHELSDPLALRDFVESSGGETLLISKRKYENEIIPLFPATGGERARLSEEVYPWQGASRNKLVAFCKGCRRLPPHPAEGRRRDGRP